MSKVYIKIDATSCYCGTDTTGYGWYEDTSKTFDENLIIDNVEETFYDYVNDPDDEEATEDNFDIGINIEEITNEEFEEAKKYFDEDDVLVKTNDGVVYFYCG